MNKYFLLFFVLILYLVKAVFFLNSVEAVEFCSGSYICCEGFVEVAQNEPCEDICDILSDPYCNECEYQLECENQGTKSCYGNAYYIPSTDTCGVYSSTFCSGYSSGAIDCSPPTSGSPSQTCAQAGGTCYTGLTSCSQQGSTAVNGTCSSGSRCCTAPEEVCGNGSCGTGESAASCPQDCTATGYYCPNGICESGENCANCWGDCGACANSCGDGVCGSGESCENCSADCGTCADPCGDGVCNGTNENSSSCPIDCPITCGDNACNGFESCDTCPADCGGACPTYQSWWQVSGGNVFAAYSEAGVAIRSEVPGDTCGAAGCVAALMAPDSTGDEETTGIPVTGGGIIDANGYTSFRDPDVSILNASFTKVRENYAYFYRRYSLGINPTDNFTIAGGNDPDNATKPTFNPSTEYYFHSGNMTIKTLWDVTPTESYVVFVDGDLTFSDPDTLRQLTNVQNGGFLAFIVSGDIIIDESLGRTSPSDTTSNLEGIFIADGTVTVETNGSADLRFNGEGSFVGWEGISLLRDYGDTDNDSYPTEYFTYRPDLLENTPQKMKRSQVLWQETN